MPGRVLVEFSVTLPNRPGALGSFDTALGRAGMDISGYLLHAEGDTGVLRFLSPQPERVEAWLQATGQSSAKREVLAIPGENRPGFVGSLGERLGAAGVNIEASYPAMLEGQGHVVLVVEPLHAALKALGM